MIPVGEPAFDTFPATGITVVSRWQVPDREQVFRQNDPSIDVKGVFPPSLPYRFPQFLDPIHPHRSLPIPQRNREKVRASRHTIPPIQNHSIPAITHSSPYGA